MALLPQTYSMLAHVLLYLRHSKINTLNFLHLFHLLHLTAHKFNHGLWHTFPFLNFYSTASSLLTSPYLQLHLSVSHQLVFLLHCLPSYSSRNMGVFSQKYTIYWNLIFSHSTYDLLGILPVTSMTVGTVFAVQLSSAIFLAPTIVPATK
jgi:hypothetical protein